MVMRLPPGRSDSITAVPAATIAAAPRRAAQRGARTTAYAARIVVAVTAKYSDSLSADTDHSNRLGSISTSVRPISAAAPPYERRTQRYISTPAHKNSHALNRCVPYGAW